jgi:integrase
MNFAALPRFLAAEAPEGADLILADLGLSSMQIDDPSLGFSFKISGPLDIRMNPTRGRTASALLSELGESGLARGIGIHSLRKSAINDAIRNGASMHEVREFAGHWDIRTTELDFVRKEEDAEVAARRIPIRAPRSEPRPTSTPSAEAESPSI